MVEEEGRPDPDSLLHRVQAEEARGARAHLKIFFGYAPGVGKTYTMLESARRLKDQGTDVVVGLVETHGRKETAALLVGLEILPRQQRTYRGIQITEFDLDAALARKPQVLILDELAHTNAPESRHPRRWQDVLELLDAGIDVYTTLNVQHMESLNDVIAQITTIHVKETVPDAVLERADEIELVDLPPEELLVRMREGRVYIPEQAQQAAQHFFRIGNLLALRELAMRLAAEKVDTDVRAYRREFDIKATWATAERILVGISPSPASARLIHGARRMAAGLKAPWVAAYVQSPGVALSADEEARLQSHIQLAESLGGEVVQLTGTNISDEILRYAREHNITRIIIGKPKHFRWLEFLKGSFIDKLVHGSGEIEVHFIADGVLVPRRFIWIPLSSKVSSYFYAVLLALVATGISFFLKPYLVTPDIVAFYLLVIMVASIWFGRGPSLLAAGLLVASYDFLFVPPFYTFAVSDLRHMLTFGIMFLIAMTVSTLIYRIRRQESEARMRERRTATLYALSQELMTVLTEEQAAEVTARHAADIFGGEAIVLLGDSNGKLEIKGRSSDVMLLRDEELAVARWSFEHGQAAGKGTATLPGASIVCLPLQSGTHTLGVLAFHNTPLKILELDQRAFLNAFMRQATLAIEFAQLSKESEATALRMRTEEMRSSLFDAVSHDLRTPLAVITGASTTLRDDEGKLTPEQRSDLLDTICFDAERMERLIRNLLDMMQLESGSLLLKKEWMPLEEIIGSALARLEARLVGRDMKMELPEDLPLILVDPVLLEQAFVNLLDNALKYTPAGSPIQITAREDGKTLIIEVSDFGPGLEAGTEQKIFDKFYRGAHPGTGGVGLGLPICRGIVEAHGGTITAENRPTGGALFRIKLPLLDKPPKLLPEKSDD